MKASLQVQVQGQVIGIPINSAAYAFESSPKRLLPDPAIQYPETGPSKLRPSKFFFLVFYSLKPIIGLCNSLTNDMFHILSIAADRVNSVLKRMNKLGKKADSFAHGVKEHGKGGSYSSS